MFGFPCNDFSVVGDRRGISGNFGGLYRWGIKGLKRFRPLFFVAENVSCLASSGTDLDVTKDAMRAVGYTIFPHTYRFEQYRVPQNRHRIIIVGFRTDLQITDFAHPQPTTKGRPLTCREALAGIAEDAPNNERTNQSATVVERLKHIKPGQNAFTADLPEHLQLSLKSGATISQIYRRLQANKPSYIVNGSGGGGTCQISNKRMSITADIPGTPMIRRSEDNLQLNCTTEDGRTAFSAVPSAIGAKIVASAVFLDLGITDSITDKHREYPSSYVIPIKAE